MKAANRLGVHPGLDQRDFRLIASGGFGDGLNAYAHSMAWFRGHLYVGTTRGNFPFMKARLPIGMDIWPVECPEDPYSLDMGAEIWRYSRIWHRQARPSIWPPACQRFWMKCKAKASGLARSRRWT